MSNTDNEIILKYVNNIKETSDEKTFEIMKSLTSKTITEHMHTTLTVLEKSKRKKFKFEIITGYYPNKFKYYYIDSDKIEHIEDCTININIKMNKNKSLLTYDEKVAILTDYVKINKKRPDPGEMYNDFDVGKFYHTTINGKIKGDKIENIILNIL